MRKVFVADDNSPFNAEYNHLIRAPCLQWIRHSYEYGKQNLEPNCI